MLPQEHPLRETFVNNFNDNDTMTGKGLNFTETYENDVKCFTKQFEMDMDHFSSETDMAEEKFRKQLLKVLLSSVNT